ncbi:hypothetical protein C2E21_0392 [Chlorella sorokiniana]|uniref:Uncharacterized protein n=1 Tax=Chlorella sorokiniana TaxID=3076 RepID=A0A2P6U4X0_CHLSO|nr:hypothetical protein C2E21_0392 [Chlorella sorokiniana]|eukprot:PRW61347.1 hypothetical protein C2E21_0392 [Chlorella sorokiniana]
MPILSPTNAVWLDAGYPETQCTTKAVIAGQAKAIAGVDLMAANAIAAACAELDSDFRCCACSTATTAEPRGFGPVPTADPNKINCVPNSGTVVKDAKTLKPFVSIATQPVGQNGCYMRLPFMQYCLKCSDDGRKCLATFNGKKYGCTGGRSIDPVGYCSLNCKGLFGIACKACDARSCLELDSTYKTGR